MACFVELRISVSVSVAHAHVVLTFFGAFQNFVFSIIFVLLTCCVFLHECQLVLSLSLFANRNKRNVVLDMRSSNKLRSAEGSPSHQVSVKTSASATSR
jgi:hypothetical protein